MDYDKQIRAFEVLMSRNPWRLSRSAQVLWFRINSLADRQGVWEVSIERSILARLIGATEKTFLAARGELEDQGLLTCERGIKSSPSKYKIKKLYE